MTTQRHRIVVEGDDATNYSAYSPDIPGVVATGATREECERELHEAIEFHLEGLDQDEAAAAAQTTTPLLGFEGVSMSYPDGRRTIAVLDRVSFEIHAGAQVGVLGRRRSGKSTLLRIAAGVEQPSGGVVRFEGRDTTTMSAKERERLMRRRVALIAEPAWPSQNMRVADYVALPLTARGLSSHEARRRARRLIDQVQIADRSDEPMRSLSLVDRLWVMLARALALEPSLLLVDEPAVMPSLGALERFLEALRSFANAEHMTLMIASEEVAALRGLDVLMSIGDGELHTTEKQAAVIDFPTRSATGEDRSNG
jgi:ABC-type lipoprotein export system ATPase subunit/predicted RNase H-like HicB family nuclease